MVRVVGLPATLLGVVCLAVACTSTPRYEVRRLAGTATWQRCAPGTDGEERPSSWCPRAVYLGAEADLAPDATDRARVGVARGGDLSGPLVVAVDVATYTPPVPGVAFTSMLQAWLEPRPELRLLARRGKNPLRLAGRRRTYWLSTPPADVEFALRGRHGARRAAWAAWAWPGGRSGERIDVPVPSVPRGARLALSFALGEPGGYRGAPGVTFAVETAGGRRLWAQRLAAADPRAAGWQDAEIDLPASEDPLALRLVATAEGGPGTFSYPVWGQPALLVPSAGEARARPNVVLVSLDTLRADEVVVGGGGTSRMPALDRFAAGGVAFRNAFSTFPSTTASHMTMMTSLHPCAHGMLMLRTALSPAATTLAEAFAAAGWSTAAITEGGLIAGGVGFARGFDRYVDQIGQDHPLGIFDRGIRRALRWIARDAHRPFFLFLHTYQAHAPYKVPPRLRDRFPVPAAGSEFERHRVDYDAGARYTDELLERLLHALERRGLLESTLVVVVSDHGEAFGEHGVEGHGTDVFPEQVHVPLIFRHPTLASGGRLVDVPVSLVDLAPTLLDAAGIPAPPSFTGRSLLPWLRGDATPPEPSPVFTEELWWARKTSFRTAQWTWRRTQGRMTLYDRTSDPRELHDVAGARPAIALTGRDRIWHFVSGCEHEAAALRKAGAPSPVRLPQTTRDALKALGYAE